MTEPPVWSTEFVSVGSSVIVIALLLDGSVGVTGLTDILYQHDADYCIADLPSRWGGSGAKLWGAGGRYPSDECGLTVL